MWKALLCALMFMSPETLFEPSELVREMSASKPKVLFVGFPMLYKGGHIKGALLAGPGSKPSALEAATQDLPKDQEIVIYCGCCPWDKCPNIHPADAWLREHGFTNVRMLHIATNFYTDWASKGYPTDKS